ncbi:hypothetical protein B0H13DRAFT_827426 [Mycena leptocephala]|nr:hypothetical protein B0H13DRAFT_827426 [Mycena leptocephala]
MDNTLWRASPVSPETLLSRLRFSLDRSGGHPLTIRVSIKAGEPHARAAVDLLSQHARRWQDVHFRADRDSASYLASAKGNLHLLKRVHFSTNWEEMDVFEVAPALTKVSFCGRAENIAKLPWSQIREFRYIGPKYMGIALSASGLSLAQQLGIGATFRFNADLEHLPLTTTWPSVSSKVQSLSLELGLNAERWRAKEMIGRIFESLTLPYLQRLRLTPRDDTLPVWNLEQFSAFAQRSILHNHLISLHIRVIITDKELLHCLSALPMLEELTISERKSRPDHISITDTFLQGITLKPDGTSLIPRLRFLSLSSLLRFTDDTYWDFVSSRVVDERNGERSPFDIELRCLRRGKRELSPELIGRLSDLVSQGDLKFALT